MERAARLFQNKRVSGDVLNLEDLVKAAWPVAVGKTIAAHTGRVRVVRNTVVVEVEDAIWQRQLFSLSEQVLRRLKAVLGPSNLEAVEFRVGIPRRLPQRAAHPDSVPKNDEKQQPLLDEADGIRDPMLKKVYQLSRKRATA